MWVWLIIHDIISLVQQTTLSKRAPVNPFTNMVYFNPNIHIHYKAWNEITLPFPNVNGAAIEVWEWITNFTHTWLIM